MSTIEIGNENIRLLVKPQRNGRKCSNNAHKHYLKRLSKAVESGDVRFLEYDATPNGILCLCIVPASFVLHELDINMVVDVARLYFKNSIKYINELRFIKQ